MLGQGADWDARRAAPEICSNKMGDNGARSLAEAVREMPNLEHLNILDNRMGVKGARSLAEAVIVARGA